MSKYSQSGLQSSKPYPLFDCSVCAHFKHPEWYSTEFELLYHERLGNTFTTASKRYMCDIVAYKYCIEYNKL